MRDCAALGTACIVVPSLMSLLGTTIGRIRLVDRLGEGGMGEVYAGVDETLGRRVAVKCVQVGERGPKIKGRFLQEARILSRLAHPNICQIYDFIESEDRDFLVMELVEGRGLDQLLREGLDEKAKLRIGQHIADVLVAAHAEGVVHRDLKPEHVMLTVDDEVKVLDFGVAHSLAVDPEETVDFSGRDAPPAPAHETVVGSVVGTPRYMSPEQARGEPVTPASDMYTFGLLLQEMLMGEPPLERQPLNTLLTVVAEGRSKPVNGLGPALTELVENLKSLAPSQRPTAKETADRLRFIRDKPMRLLRRALAAAAVLLVLAGVAKYTVDLQRERAEAVAAREQAEGLVGFMMEDLSRGLQPIGKLGLLEQVAREVLDYYEQAPESASGDPAFLRGRAFRHVGEVLDKNGDLEAALEAVKTAKNIHQRLVDEDADRGEWHNALALDYILLGNLYRQQGERRSAQEAFHAGRAIAARLVELEPEETPWRLTLADSYYSLGLFHMFNDPEKAEKSFRDSLAIYRRLADRDPANLFYRYRQAVLYGQGLGQVHGLLGKPEESFAAVREAYSLYEVITRADPSNARWQHGFAWENRRLAEHQIRLGRLDDALASHHQAREVTERLLSLEPSQVDWQMALSFDHLAIGDVLSRQSDYLSALESYRRSLELRQNLVATEPSNDYFQEEVAAVHIKIGDSLAALGRPEAAAEAWETSVEILAPFAASAERPDGYMWELSALALLRLGRVDEARPVIEKLRPVWPKTAIGDELADLCRRHGVAVEI